MSHRINIETKINDRNLAIKAIQKKGWAFADQGSSLRITNGPMSGITIDLKTGSVAGDSDHHDRSTLGGLNSGYAEALIEDDIARQNGTILSRVVQKSGAIEIMASVQLHA